MFLFVVNYSNRLAFYKLGVYSKKKLNQGNNKQMTEKKLFDWENKFMIPKLKKALSVFHELKSIKFLYINSALLLEAAPKNVIKEALNKPDLPLLVKFELVLLMNSFDKVTGAFNKQIERLNRIRKGATGFHIPKNSGIETELASNILNGKLELSNFPKGIFEKTIVKNLTCEDYVKPQKGDKLNWLNFMIPDGKVFPYTILPDNAFSEYGFPIGLYTKGNESIDPTSIKNVYYEDPRTKRITKGVYFEVYEGPGDKGPGGVNGILVEEGKPIIIINTSKNEAYFVNVNEKTKSLPCNSLIEPKFAMVC